MTDHTACREAFDEWTDARGLQYEQSYFAVWQAAWNTRAEPKGGEAVACWSLAYRGTRNALFADCIYDNEDDAKSDAAALNGDTGDLVPIPLYTHSPRATAVEDARDAARYRWLREHFKFANDSMSELWFDICLDSTSKESRELDHSIDSVMPG